MTPNRIASLLSAVLLSLLLLCELVTVEAAFKIYNGDPVSTWKGNKFKFIAALVGRSLCSGVVYSGNTLISAGHCFKGNPTPTEVSFGVVNAKAKSDQRLRINHVYTRGDYNQGFQKSSVNGRDIAVVKLVKSIAIARWDVSVANFKMKTRPKVGTVLVIVGFGRDSAKAKSSGQLKSGELTVSECKDKEMAGKPLCLTPKSGDKRQQNEQGDSGGPALLSSKGEYAVVGISSGIVGYPNGDVEAVYASIAANRLHIEKYN